MGVIMYDQIELNQRLVIIKHSDINDVEILDENYKQLMRTAPTDEEQKQFEILHSVARSRIEELKTKK